MKVRTAATALAALLLLAAPSGVLAQQEEDQGPPPELLLSNAQSAFVTAEDKRQTGEGDPTSDYREAIKEFHRYLEAKPGISTEDSASVYLKIADAYWEMGSFNQDPELFAESISYYQWLIDRDPENQSRPYNLIRAGYAVWQTEGLDEAVPYYREYIELQPDDLPQRRVLAQALMSQGQMAECVEHYLAYFEQSPHEQDVVNQLLTLRSRLPQQYERITLSLAAKRPDTPKYLLDLGQYYIGQREREKGIDYIQQYLEQQPEDLEGWAILADAFNNMGEYDQALQALRRVLEVDPEHVSAQTQIARIYLDRGDIDRAITEAQQALNIDSDDPGANAIMGDAAWEWLQRKFRREEPGKELNEMPYNFKVLIEDQIVGVYYEKAREGSEWRSHADSQIQYLSQLYPSSSDRFMAPEEDKVPIVFPPPR
ncbi:MAG: tetratricopeptide repeat protein [bacterium]